MDEPRISLHTCRKLLGEIGTSRTDDELDAILREVCSLAEVIVLAHGEVSQFDDSLLNPPGVEEALRRLGWDLDDDYTDDWRDDDAAEA